MKRRIIFTMIVSLLSFGMIDSAMTNDIPSSVSLEKLEEERLLREIEEKRLEEERIKQYHEDELQRFLTDIGHRESGNRYDITNKWGYMGKYQFGKSTLKTIKIKVSKTEFLNNPELQEEAMLKLLRYNKKRLQKYIDKFDGQTINGILITESGLLAAAHLGGAGSVKKWFRTGKVKKDGNGIKITSYMERFSGYNLYL